MSQDKGLFVRIAEGAAFAAGHPAASIIAFSAIIIWGISGPLFGFSDTWQLVINTGTTIVTFLMVFLIQNSQNRDSKAVQLKLDELIRATEGAHTVLLDIEELSDKELAQLRDRYEAIAKKARANVDAGKSDTDIPEVDLDFDITKIQD